MAMRAAAIVLRPMSTRAIAKRIETDVSRLCDLVAIHTLKTPARSEVPIEIEMAIEAGFAGPSITWPLQAWRSPYQYG